MVIGNNSVVVFDLDDTLYKEIEYLKSAFREIAQTLQEECGHHLYERMMSLYYDQREVFGTVIEQYQIESKSKNDLIEMYRSHKPALALEAHVEEKLREMKEKSMPVGLITDGRSHTQRNKLQALGLDGYFDEILISEEFKSEKPDFRNFKYMEDKLQGGKYVYIADNIQKDFIAPNKLGWDTVCLLANGSNIHEQNFSKIGDDRLKSPKFRITDFGEIKIEDHQYS